jgi:hypothetical protein
MQNIQLLHIQEAHRAKFDSVVALHKRHSSITFKILSVEDKVITLSITQERCHSENYFDNKRLSEIGHELLVPFIAEEYVIHTQTFRYTTSNM